MEGFLRFTLTFVMVCVVVNSLPTPTKTPFQEFAESHIRQSDCTFPPRVVFEQLTMPDFRYQKCLQESSGHASFTSLLCSNIMSLSKRVCSVKDVNPTPSQRNILMSIEDPEGDRPDDTKVSEKVTKMCSSVEFGSLASSISGADCKTECSNPESFFICDLYYAMDIEERKSFSGIKNFAALDLYLLSVPRHPFPPASVILEQGSPFNACLNKSADNITKDLCAAVLFIAAQASEINALKIDTIQFVKNTSPNVPLSCEKFAGLKMPAHSPDVLTTLKNGSTCEAICGESRAIICKGLYLGLTTLQGPTAEENPPAGAASTPDQNTHDIKDPTSQNEAPSSGTTSKTDKHLTNAGNDADIQLSGNDTHKTGNKTDNQHSDTDPDNQQTGTGTNTQETGTNADNQQPGTDADNQQPGTDADNQQTGTNTQETGTGADNQQIGTGTNTPKTGTGADNQQTGTGTNTQKTDTGADNQQTGTDADNQQTGTDSKPQQTGFDAENQQTGTNTNTQQTGTETDNQQTGNEVDTQQTGTETDNQQTGNEADNQQTDIGTNTQDSGSSLDNQQTGGGTNTKPTSTGTNTQQTGMELDNQQTGTDADNQQTGTDSKPQQTGTDAENQRAGTGTNTADNQQTGTNTQATGTDSDKQQTGTDTGANTQPSGTGTDTQPSGTTTGTTPGEDCEPGKNECVENAECQPDWEGQDEKIGTCECKEGYVEDDDDGNTCVEDIQRQTTTTEEYPQSKDRDDGKDFSIDDNSIQHEDDNQDRPHVAANPGPSYMEDESEKSGTSFISYFLVFTVLVIAGYLIFHNKQKIIALVVEGKTGGRNGRRPNTKEYRQLKTDDVMPSLEKSASHKNYVF